MQAGSYEYGSDESPSEEEDKERGEDEGSHGVEEESKSSVTATPNPAPVITHMLTDPTGLSPCVASNSFDVSDECASHTECGAKYRTDESEECERGGRSLFLLGHGWIFAISIAQYTGIVNT